MLKSIRSLVAFAAMALVAAVASAPLVACATDPPTIEQRLALAQVGVAAACDTAGLLVGTGDIAGKDADRVAASCTAARLLLADLQASVPLAVAATPAPATSAPSTAASSPGT